MVLILAFLSLLITIVSSSPVDRHSNQSTIHWDDLKLTYSYGLIGGFNSVPRLEREAIRQGWVQIPSLNCFNGGVYNGIRYRMPEDNSAILMYDVTGVIAGIQMWTLQSDILSRKNTFRFGSVPAFTNATIDRKTYFVLTAYFADPTIICTTGRGEGDLEITGTGTGVYIQTGPNPYTYLQIPYRRDSALASGFSDNNCFPTIGRHSWYKMEEYEATNCNEHIPAFGLYDTQGLLLGFGFSVTGTTVNHRYGNPTVEAARLITGKPGPQCLLDGVEKFGNTDFHIYFISTPRLIAC